MDKSRSDLQGGRILSFCFVLNLLLWVLMWLTFLLHARQYTYRGEPIEGAYPWQVVLGRALSPNVEPTAYLGYKLVFLANFPSYVATVISFNLMFHGQRSPIQYLGTTVGGYELIAWMLLSFVQWYCIARLLIWVRKKRAGSIPIRLT